MARIIAIDLGSYAVKAAVYESSGRRVELVDRVAVTVGGDHETPLQGWSEALGELLSTHARWRAPGNLVGLALPGGMAVMHDVEVPFTDQAQIDQTLPFTIEEHVPFDMEEMVLGWRVISEGVGTHCLVGLAPAADVSELLGLLGERQLDPREAMIGGDLLGYFCDSPARAIVDVGHKHTTVTVGREGQALGSRILDVGGWHFTRAIAQALDIDMAAAEAMKLRAGGAGIPGDTLEHAPELPEQAARAVDSQMGLLLAGVRSALITMEDRFGMEIEEVMLTGGGGRMAPFADYLRQDLGLPVEPLADPMGEPVPADHALTHSVAMAIAGKTSSVVDLRVGELGFRGGSDILRTVALGSMAAVAVVLLTCLGLGAYQYANIYGERTEMEARIKDYTVRNFEGITASSITDATRAATLAAAVTASAVQQAEILGGVDGKPPTIDVLFDLTKAFPPAEEVTVNVSKVYITPTNMTVDAETGGYTEAAAVEASIKKLPRFAEATKGEDTRKRDKVQFSISIPLGEEG